MSLLDILTPQKETSDLSCGGDVCKNIVDEDFLSNSDCAICLISFEDDGKSDVSTTRCKHKFHTNCLLQSKLKGKIECPMCRSKLTPPHRSVIERIIETSTETSGDLRRETIVQASRRGREAVRLALIRRNRLSSNVIDAPSTA